MQNLFLLIFIVLSAASTNSTERNVIVDYLTKFTGDAKSNLEVQHEAGMNTMELIKMNGHKPEKHHVQTADKYILALHRIPRGKNVTKKQPGPPILIMHGLFSLSSTWVDNRENSLAFKLADHGYDIWLGNLRGNRYTSHTSHSRDSKEFWNFSWDEHAKYDIPAEIDYILKTTGTVQLLYIGFSTGSLAMFATLSSLPEYNQKISGFVALAPMTSLTYSTSILFKHFWKQIEKTQSGTNFDHYFSYLASDPLIHNIIFSLCPISNPILCDAFFGVVGGYNPYFSNKTTTPIFSSHALSGISVKYLVHLAQCHNSKRMMQFDYGQKTNLWKYGMTSPLSYEISKISVPVSLHYAANDALTTPMDVQLTIRQLKNVVDVDLNPSPMTTHYNLLWPDETNSELQEKIINNLKTMWPDFSA